MHLEIKEITDYIIKLLYKLGYYVSYTTQVEHCLPA